MGQRPLTGKILPGIAKVTGGSMPWFSFENTAKEENNELEMLENELMEEMKYFEKTQGQNLQPAGTFGTSEDDVVEEADDEEDDEDDDEDNNEDGGGNNSGREDADGEIVDDDDVEDDGESSGSNSSQTPSPPPAPVARVVTRSLSVGRRGRGLAGMPRRGTHH